MGNAVRLIVTLVVIAVVASFGLSAVYNATYEITAEYKRREQALARIEALGCSPEAYFVETKTDSVVSNRPFIYYTAYPSKDEREPIGYSFIAYGKGYSSTIETIVGVDRDGSICGIKITYQQETPGLGAKVMEVASTNTLWDVMMSKAENESGVKPWFQTQFNGKSADQLNVVKRQGEPGILAITGATISSEAVTSSVREGLDMLLSIVGKGAVGSPAGTPEERAGASAEPGASSEEAAPPTATSGATGEAP